MHPRRIPLFAKPVTTTATFHFGANSGKGQGQGKADSGGAAGAGAGADYDWRGPTVEVGVFGADELDPASAMSQSGVGAGAEDHGADPEPEFAAAGRAVRVPADHAYRPANLKALLHSQGTNLRHLGTLYRQVLCDVARRRLLTEMVARCLRVLFHR